MQGCGIVSGLTHKSKTFVSPDTIRRDKQAFEGGWPHPTVETKAVAEGVTMSCCCHLTALVNALSLIAAALPLSFQHAADDSALQSSYQALNRTASA